MNADTLLCSHPRSGGRWLRYLLAHYLGARHRLEAAVTPQTVFSVVPDHHDELSRGYPAFRYPGHRQLPLVAVCHQSYTWEHHRGFPVVFLARNAYDVMVSAHAYTRAKVGNPGAMRDFIRHPKLGLAAWLEYMNSWAPKLLTHRDALLLSYRELDGDPARALTRLLEFLNETPDPELVMATVASGNELRGRRDIRTGQEGNFWDQLQPDEIFDIQGIVRTELSDFATHLLDVMGVEVDPLPRDLDEAGGGRD